jgi:Cu(I)/Ag(I) efflux system membrane fusion protein
MTDDSSNNEPVHDAAEPTIPSAASPERGHRLLLAARAVQVRLRFVAVLAAAFLVIGLWGNLRNYWDTLTHTFSGSHVAEHSISADTEYFCPMDPGVISDWPAICPVCNMDLVRRKKGEAVLLPEGVVARMQFSPYRIQLAGIKTAVVSRRRLAREIVLAGRLIDAGGVTAPAPGEAVSTNPTESGQLFILTCEAGAGDVGLLAIGRQADVAIEALPGLQPFAGKISSVREIPGEANGRHRMTVEIALDASERALRAEMFGTARVAVPFAEIEPSASARSPAGKEIDEGPVAVPETAVVDTGSRRIVFVETMPGMFDGVEVTLGPRCGDFFPVLAGLAPGQRVAAVGAFLIDAEARLSPNLAAGYFGAARTVESGTPPPAPAVAESAKHAARKKAGAKLSAADQQLVKIQRTCPVTDLPLDSMGGPVAVDVLGQRVFICCKGCEAKLKSDPQKYLAKLKHD